MFDVVSLWLVVFVLVGIGIMLMVVMLCWVLVDGMLLCCVVFVYGVCEVVDWLFVVELVCSVVVDVCVLFYWFDSYFYEGLVVWGGWIDIG